MSITAVGGYTAPIGYPAAKPSAPLPSAETASAANDAVTKEFLDFARMSPAEKIRYAYLQAHGISEDDLKAMSPEKRAAVEAAIRDEIRKSVQNAAERKSGLITDLRA